MLTRARSKNRFRPLDHNPSREQRIAELDRCMLWNYWLIEDGENPSVDSRRVRQRIDRLLDARLYLMQQACA